MYPYWKNMLAKLQGKQSFQFWHIFANFRPEKNLVLTSTSKKMFWWKKMEKFTKFQEFVFVILNFYSKFPIGSQEYRKILTFFSFHIWFLSKLAKLITGWSPLWIFHKFFIKKTLGQEVRVLPERPGTWKPTKCKAVPTRIALIFGREHMDNIYSALSLLFFPNLGCCHIIHEELV
jgi:hypothetical protein